MLSQCSPHFCIILIFTVSHCRKTPWIRTYFSNTRIRYTIFHILIHCSSLNHFLHKLVDIVDKSHCIIIIYCCLAQIFHFLFQLFLLHFVMFFVLSGTNILHGTLIFRKNVLNFYLKY